MPKKYLVTGGAGFIGSNLVDALIKAGHNVTVIDNFATGKKENLNPKAKFFEADIRNLAQISPHFKNIDGVFHVAALPRVQPSIADPITPNETNITGTLNVLWAAKNAGVKRVVYSSSSSAYGDSQELPLKETLRPNPMSPYALQKYVGEEYSRLFSRLYGIETVSLRYFNVYGPRMISSGAYVTAIKIFLSQKKAGEPLTIVGDGEQTRDFTNVADVVRANMLSIKSAQVGRGEVINIGPGKIYSINQIAKIIGGKVIHLPPRVEPRHTLADNSLAKKLLRWKPQEDLPTTIKKMVGELKIRN